MTTRLTTARRAGFALLIALIALPWGATHAQRAEDPGHNDWWAKENGLEAARAKTVEAARTQAAYLKQSLLKAFESARKPMSKEVATLMEV